MDDAFLIPLPDARCVRLAHNENRSTFETVAEFIRNRNLRRAFPNRKELRLAIASAELWTMTVSNDDIARPRTYAASRLPKLLLFASGQLVIDLERPDSGLLPPLPRHDYGLVLERVTERDGERFWSLTWSEIDPLLQKRLTSQSLHLLIGRSLELSLMVAENAHTRWMLERSIH